MCVPDIIKSTLSTFSRRVLNLLNAKQRHDTRTAPQAPMIAIIMMKSPFSPVPSLWVEVLDRDELECVLVINGLYDRVVIVCLTVDDIMGLDVSRLVVDSVVIPVLSVTALDP